MSKHSAQKRHCRQSKRGERYLPLNSYRAIKSGHTTEIVSRPRVAGKKEPALYVRKQFDRPYLAEIEAAMSAYYRLHLPRAIPKVRVQEDGMHTLSKILPGFIDLKTYLVDGFTAEKKTLLISRGLPEILALSIIAEEDDLHAENIGIFDSQYEQLVGRIDFDMSAYSFISRESLRGPRSYDLFGSSGETRFLLTADDINDFPILHKADPFYWVTKKTITLATHGYSDAEIQAFRELADDKDFKHRAYRFFLKSILMPDQAIKDVFSAFISNSATIESPPINILNFLQTNFLAKKANFKKTLLQSTKFMKWFESLDVEELSSIFDEFSEYNRSSNADTEIDLNDATLSYHLFCRESIKRRSESFLASLVALSHEQGASLVVKNPLISIMTSLTTFLSKNSVIVADFSIFLSALSNAMFVIESSSINKNSDKFKEAQEDYRAIARALGKYVAEKKSESTVDDSVCAEFVKISVPHNNDIAEEVAVWFCQSDRREKLAQLYKRSCEEYKSNNPHLFRFFCADPFADLKKYYQEILTAENPDAISRIISQMIALQTPTSNAVSLRFIGLVIQIFAIDVALLPLTERVKSYPYFSKFLATETSDHRLSPAGEENLVRIFIEGISPQASNDGEWENVQHSSNSFAVSAGSFCKK